MRTKRLFLNTWYSVIHGKPYLRNEIRAKGKLTCDIKILFSTFPVPHIETSERALRCTIPQLLMLSVILQAGDHVLAIALEDFLIGLIRGLLWHSCPEYRPISTSSKQKIIVKVHLHGRDRRSVERWALPLNGSQLRPDRLNASACAKIPKFDHLVLACWEQDHAIRGETQLFDEIGMLSF